MRILIARLLPALALLLAWTNSHAQPDGQPSPERLREIKAQKSAFITARLELTPEEAQRFWPIYNEFDDKQDALRKEMRQLFKEPGKEAELTEAEAAALLEKGLQHRQQEIDLEKSYLERFKKSIGSVKTMRLRQAEHDFNREVLRKFRDRMDERKGDHRPPQRH